MLLSYCSIMCPFVKIVVYSMYSINWLKNGNYLQICDVNPGYKLYDVKISIKCRCLRCP